MNKLNQFFKLFVLMLFLTVAKSYGCVYAYNFYSDYTPHLFRVSPLIERTAFSDGFIFENSVYNAIVQYVTTKEIKKEKQENCKLWQQQTSSDISLQDIEDVLYNVSVSTLQDLLQSKCENTFVQFLQKEKNQDFVSYILLLKAFHEKKVAYLDPWYYPYEKGEKLIEFSDIELPVGNAILHDRCVLLEMKILFEQQKWADCEQLWKKEHKKMKESFLKESLYGYYVGALYRTKPSVEVIRSFSKIGDYLSMIRCAETIMPEKDCMYLFDMYCNDNLNSQSMPAMLQIMGEYAIRMEKCDVLLKTALRMVKRKDCEEPAMWYYTIATMEFFQKLNNHFPYESFAMGFYYGTSMYDDWRTYNKSVRKNYSYLSDLLTRAEQSRGNAFIKESIQMFRYALNIESGNCSSDEYVGSALKYFSQIDKKYNHDYVLNSIMTIMMLSHSTNNILSGDTIRALQSLNVADGDFTQPAQDQYKRYYSSLFEIMESLPVQSVISYVNSLSQPKNSNSQYLKDLSYIVDMNYFNEYIGTRYLREQNYKAAIQYLSKVPLWYQNRLKTNEYMDRDYFSHRRYRKIADNSSYKLTFAKKMLDLENRILTEKNPNKKGELLIQKAVAVGNSLSYCWSLTRYYSSISGDWFETQEAQKILKQAIRTFTDKEIAARCLYNVDMHPLIRKHYNDTKIANYMRSHCDTRKDYAEK